MATCVSAGAGRVGEALGEVPQNRASASPAPPPAGASRAVAVRVDDMVGEHGTHDTGQDVDRVPGIPFPERGAVVAREGVVVVQACR